MSRHHHKDRLTLNEIHDLLDNIDQETVTVAINPPHEEPDANTDCDSDASDDEVTCNPDHLSLRILSAEVNSIANEEPLEENEDTNHDLESPSTSAEPPKKRKKRTRKYEWHQNKIRVMNTVPDYVQHQNNELTKLKEDCTKLFWTDEWIEELCEQSKLYASQKSLPSDHVTPEKLKVFITILVISGYNKLPSRRLYWSESPDVFNQLISESIRRDAFEQIMCCLHFADNMKMTDDKFYKVRPLIQHLNQVNKPKYSQEFYSIDEVMIPYYGRHSSKQFIKGKPIRFGFNVWAACTADGFLLHAEPYCGLYTNISDTGLGQGPNEVMEMVKKINLEAGQHVVFDNLFTSVPLLEKLGDQGIGATGTLREDRLSGAPVMAKKVMEKKTRGYMEEAFTGCISVVKWKDNKVVAVGSNKERKTPVNKTKRWCNREKKTCRN
ncbi:hypothetical protein Pmani_034580 [Petrolisthes manimaculis]|uniref:PiggyBac transposable element-derived protein domain-containing protein n=1 Tax=Petrolisthes manimaculis TaxID=1843537 RepID=A0AAE1NMF9_9EUCA|nr:hypothetical protein Pmani_034580 [Petrolisthes manimaculis]